MAEIFIVTESGCDVTQRDCKKHNIKIVPMHVSINGASLDDGSFPVEDIFNSFRSTGILPKTSAANPKDYDEIFDRIKEKHPNAIIIHIGYSAVTTASFHNAILACENRPDIIHIDSKQVSVAGRAIVIKTAQFIENNPLATVDQIKDAIGNYVDKCRFSFFPGQLEYLKAGGRVSNAGYLVATALGLKPLIEMKDGKLTATKKYRGSNQKVFARFLDEHLAAHSYEKDSFFMCFSPGIEKSTFDTLMKTAQKHGYPHPSILATGCVISTHAGPGAFGVGGFEK